MQHIRKHTSLTDIMFQHPHWYMKDPLLIPSKKGFDHFNNIDIMSTIDICYTTYHLGTQTVEPDITGFQGHKSFILYLDRYTHKTSYTYNSYEGSNIIRLTWCENQIKHFTNQNFLYCHQDTDHDIILNRGRLVSGIIHTLIRVAV